MDGLGMKVGYSTPSGGVEGTQYGWSAGAGVRMGGRLPGLMDGLGMKVGYSTPSGGVEGTEYGRAAGAGHRRQVAGLARHKPLCQPGKGRSFHPVGC